MVEQRKVKDAFSLSKFFRRSPKKPKRTKDKAFEGDDSPHSNNISTADSHEFAVSDEVDRIRDQVASAVIDGVWGFPEFLPHDSFEKIAQRHTLMNILTGLGVADAKTRKDIFEKGRVLFVCLLEIGKERDISKVWELGIRDEDLPLTISENRGSNPLELFSENHGPDPLPLSFWGSHAKKTFEEKQYRFLAKVFTEDDRDHRVDLPPKAPVPLSERSAKPLDSGAYGRVYRARLHPAHCIVDKPRPEDEEGIDIALKLIPGEVNYDTERRMLRSIRKLKDRHLIEVIGTFRYRQENYIMSRWANGGNLREFWRKENLGVSPGTFEAVRWSLQQMRALVNAVHRLHTLGLQTRNNKANQGGNETVRNARHGDIKPENILLCTNKSTCMPGEGIGILLLGDMGLGREREGVTQARLPTDEGEFKIGTKRYMSPELADETMDLSRMDDTWALGCTFLEFIVWILYGRVGSLSFNEGFNSVTNQSFFVTTPQEHVKLQGDVASWISYIREHDLVSDNDTCTSMSLRDLLEFIETRLLVPDEREKPPAALRRRNTHGTSSAVSIAMTDDNTSARSSFSNIDRPGSDEIIRPETPTLDSKPAIVVEDVSSVPRLLVRQPSDNITPRQEPLRRATAQEFLGMLDKIHEQGQRDQNYFLRCAPKGSPNGPSYKTAIPAYGESLLVPDPGKAEARNSSVFRANTQNPYVVAPLNDIWTLIVDNDIPSRVLPYLSDKRSIAPPMSKKYLCSSCKSLDIFRPNFIVEDSLGAYRERAAECPLCSLFVWAAEKAGDSDPKETIRFSRSGSSLQRQSHRSPILSLVITEGRHKEVSGLQMGFPVLPPIGGQIQMQLLVEWLRTCDKYHSCAPTGNGRPPTRLLDLGDGPDSVTLRLNCDPAARKSSRYAALSHRWGDPIRHPALITTRDNLAEFEAGLSLQTLPASFRDAVRVTRAMGLRYLWIDSLCIIQNDAEDWAAEGKRMEDVFSSAYFTIVATSAEGSSDGFLKHRPPRRCVPVPQVNGSVVYICESIDDFRNHVELADLNTRGWVFQERALSRRSIYFSSTQVYWECGKGVHCETLTRMTNLKASFLADPEFPRSAIDYYKGMRIRFFQTLFEEYSRRDFTRLADRSVALSGLEERLARAYATRSAFGVLETYLLRSLMWERASPQPLARIEFPAEQESPPSWSFMAVAGEVRYVDMPFDGVEWSQEVKSPFFRREGQRLAIPAVMCEFISERVKAVLDRLDTDMASVKCIVVGRRKEMARKDRVVYTILVEDLSNGAWERVGRCGVATMRESAIKSDTGLEVEIV